MNNYLLNKRPLCRCVLVILALICHLKKTNAQNHNSVANSFNAIVRSDNSFVTYNDTLSKREPIPQILKNKIIKIYAVYHNDPFSDQNYHPIIFKVSYSTSIDIYIIKVYSSSGVNYKFVAFDHRLKKSTSNPVSIFGGFMENSEQGFSKEDRLLNSPYIYFDNITLKFDKNIIVKERVHNGTIYNGEVDHVFSLNKNLNFVRILNIESKMIDYNSNCMITRSFKNDTITCKVLCKYGKPEIIVGKVFLNLNPYPVVIGKKCFNENYCNLLITGSSVDEMKFLRYGSSYSY